MAFSLAPVFRVLPAPPTRLRRVRDGVAPQSGSAVEEEVLGVGQSAPTRAGDERLTGQWPEDSRADAPGPSWPLVFLFFLALAVVQTFPLALHMNDHAMGWAG